jgi:hypothetical protein
MNINTFLNIFSLNIFQLVFMNWKKAEEFYIDTGEKRGNYKLLQCKACVWAFEHAEEQGIIVDEHKFERRIIQLEGHIKRCPYKSLVPLVPESLPQLLGREWCQLTTIRFC